MLQSVASAPGSRSNPRGSPWRSWPDSVVERAITICGGQPADLQAKVARVLDRPVAKQTVHSWRLRGVFPKEMILAVHEATGISVEELLLARPRTKPRDNPVVRAVKFAGGTSSKLAAALAKSSGREVTRQMVANWLAAGKVPRGWVLDIHLLTKIPIDDMITNGEGE